MLHPSEYDMGVAAMRYPRLRSVQDASGNIAADDRDRAHRISWSIWINTHTWTKAFCDVGLVGCQDEVSARVQQKLSVDVHHLNVPNSMPTLQQFQAVFPQRTVLHFELLFRGLLREQRPAAPRAKASRPLLSVGDTTAPSWLGRTRSSSSLAAVLPPTSALVPAWRPAMAPAELPPRPPPFLPSAKRLYRPRSRRVEEE